MHLIELGEHPTRASGDLGLTPCALPVCAGVHAVFVEGAFEELLASGAARVVTCNAVPHATNAIDLTASVAGGIRSVHIGN